MDIKNRLSKSTLKLNILLVIFLLLLIIAILLACKFLWFIFQKGSPIEHYQYESSTEICIEEVFKNYKERWNSECANIPEELVANPNTRDMDNGFACGLPQSIAKELNKSKQLMEEKCMGEIN
jgi:hypothetical protein